MTKVTDAKWRHQLYFWGHLAKGVVYLMVGGLALAAVLGSSGTNGPKGPQRILTYLRDEPGGTVILLILALGLFAYCGWRWYKAISDEGDDGTDSEGLAQRAGYAVSGTLHGLLGLYSLTLVTNGGTKGDKQDILLKIIQSPVGIYLVGLLAIMALYAAYRQFERVRTKEYMNDLRTDKMTKAERHTYRIMGRVGYASRVIVYLVVTYLLVKVVLSGDPSKYQGMGDVLSTISQGAGTVLLAIVSLGLFLYGAFVLVKARYRELS